MLSKTPVHLYAGSNVALGTAAGKLFRVGVMSIESGGDSDLLTSVSLNLSSNLLPVHPKLILFSYSFFSSKLVTWLGWNEVSIMRLWESSCCCEGGK